LPRLAAAMSSAVTRASEGRPLLLLLLVLVAAGAAPQQAANKAAAANVEAFLMCPPVRVRTHRCKPIQNDRAPYRNGGRAVNRCSLAAEKNPRLNPVPAAKLGNSLNRNYFLWSRTRFADSIALPSSVSGPTVGATS